MKLLQLNMWLGRLTPQILTLIDNEDPDLITSQEVYKGGDTVQFPDNMFTIYEQIAKKYPYHHFSAAHGTKIAHSVGKMGNAIFSKYPIVESDDFFTSGAYVEDLTVESAIANSRTLQTVKIDANGTKLVLINTHAYWDISPLGNEKSVEKMQIIADHVRSFGNNTPLIFAGDLNVSPLSPAMRSFDGLLNDLIATSDIKSTISSIRDLGDIPCDHILINNWIEPHVLYTREEIVSDHKPLILEFNIKNTNTA